ncbi:MAG: hypothetical protein ACLURV_11920 [Gallintestinimicrobium sp.]
MVRNATVFLLWNKGNNGNGTASGNIIIPGVKTEQMENMQMILKSGWMASIRAVIVDSAAASFIAELGKRGYRVLKADNDVEMAYERLPHA